jgi:Rrf2 family protein
MVLLKRGHLVNAARGPSGGYVLARPPETISVREILSVLEGPDVGFELKAQMHGRSMSKVTQRLIGTWARGVRAMETVLEETTLADLCKPEVGALMYYI